MHESSVTLADLLGEPASFVVRPVAYYDKHMDCIRIELRDCSLTEVRVNKMLTLLHDNHPSEHQTHLAGIMIKGVKHLFNEWGLPLEGVLMVTTIIDRLLQTLPADPENAPEKEIREVLQITSAIELEVDFDNVSHAAA